MSILGGVSSMRSFLVSTDNPSIEPSSSFSYVKRNLESEIHRITREDSTAFLQPPSPRETVSVYLRVKPKTPGNKFKSQIFQIQETEPGNNTK